MVYRKTAGVKAHLKERRAAILDAGLAILTKHGREGFTTPRVAERAGVSNGTLYQYFADADELWAAVIASALARDRIAIRAAAEAERYPANALARAIKAFYGGLDKPRLASALADAPAYRRGIREELAALIAPVGDFPPRATEQYAAAILGALIGLADIGATDKSAVTYSLTMLGVPNLAARALA